MMILTERLQRGFLSVCVREGGGSAVMPIDWMTTVSTAAQMLRRCLHTSIKTLLNAHQHVMANSFSVGALDTASTMLMTLTNTQHRPSV
jgi:hypothetical protein